MRIRSIDPDDDKKKKKKAVIRNKPARVERINGELKAIKGEDYYDSDEDIAYRRELKKRGGDGTYDGAPAPRVGGPAPKSGGSILGGTKKMLKKAARRVRKSAASPQAKKSAIRLYRA